jgi:tetratricopeptide (TPR) repeat protein
MRGENMREQKRIRRQRKQPMNLTIVVLLVSLVLSSCAGLMISGEAQYTYEQGLALFNQGRFSEAIPIFEKAILLEPDFYQAHLYLGRSHLNLRAYGKALAPLRNAYRLSPNDFKGEVADLLIDALLGTAFSELKEGNIQTSLSYIREVLLTDPKSKKIKDDLSLVLVAVATELFKSGKVREAVKEYTEAIKANPNNTGAYVGLAKALFKSGDFLKALNAAEKAVSIDPDSKEALGVIKDLLKK